MSSMTLTATEPLAERCRENFLARTIQDGQRLFQAGSVEMMSLKGHHAHVHVPSNKRRVEHCVDVEWQQTRETHQLQVNCACRNFSSGANCEHLWAAFLKLDEQRVYVQVPGRGSLNLVEQFDLDEAQDDTSESGVIQRLPPNRLPSPAQPPDW